MAVQGAHRRLLVSDVADYYVPDQSGFAHQTGFPLPDGEGQFGSKERSSFEQKVGHADPVLF